MAWWQELFRPDLWDWGDVATWATGIFTAAPLFLALALLQRERKRELSRQAKATVAFADWDYEHVADLDDQSEQGKAHVTVHIWNYSDRPIFQVLFFWKYSAGSGPETWDNYDSSPSLVASALEPGKEVVIKRTVVGGVDQEFAYSGVMFDDTDRNTWAIDLDQYRKDRLMTHKEWLKWIHRTEGELAQARGSRVPESQDSA